jgi:hypothetical protein
VLKGRTVNNELILRINTSQFIGADFERNAVGFFVVAKQYLFRRTQILKNVGSTSKF